MFLKLVAKYDKYLKKPAGDIKDVFSTLFDITNPKGNWLCREDKEFYQNQMTFCGKVGYVAGKESAKNKIHPSKRIKKSVKTSISNGNSDEDVEETTKAAEDANDEERGKKKCCSSANVQ
ncbi:hypothetical protein Btru_069990 [Bulinus truncatus]|nr:hypothetical protein Btru_069990 [Bulinus truncatus]